jgi:hypothetical protein
MLIYVFLLIVFWLNIRESTPATVTGRRARASARFIGFARCSHERKINFYVFLPRTGRRNLLFLRPVVGQLNPRQKCLSLSRAKGGDLFSVLN